MTQVASFMRVMPALIRREYLEGRNGYLLTPVVIACVVLGLTLLGSLGFGDVGIEDNGARITLDNLGSAIDAAVDRAGRKGAQNEVPAVVALVYWSMSVLIGIALPFVIVFALLGALYEERRDKSILFWKSMPVTDWQEVTAKLVMAAFLAPAIFLLVMFAAQFLVAVTLSLVVLFQGGPVAELWPLGFMITSWLQAFSIGFFKLLWMLPLFGWLLFVSAFAKRLPFLVALLPIIVVIAVEAIMLKSNYFGEWLAYHLGGWQFNAFATQFAAVDGPRDFLETLIDQSPLKLLMVTLGDIRFWLGLAITGLFLYGAVRCRMRAV